MKNPYKFKSDEQLICLALVELLSKLSDPDIALLNELQDRGCEVKKASKFWNDKQLKKEKFI